MSRKTGINCFIAYSHQIRQVSAGAIGAPTLQENASRNAGMLRTVPLTRNFPGECGSVIALRREASAVKFSHQICANPRKTAVAR